MKISMHRVLAVAVVVAVTAFLLAGLAGNHHSGARGTIGDVAWLTFLVALLGSVVMSVVILSAASLRRWRRRP